MVVGWSPMDWWQNNCVSSNSQFKDISGRRSDEMAPNTAGPGRSCDAGGRDETCPERHIAAADGSWFAISGLMVLETSTFYPLIETVLLLNRVSSILYFNPLAMG